MADAAGYSIVWPWPVAGHGTGTPVVGGLDDARRRDPLDGTRATLQGKSSSSTVLRVERVTHVPCDRGLGVACPASCVTRHTTHPHRTSPTVCAAAGLSAVRGGVTVWRVSHSEWSAAAGAGGVRV